LLALGYQMFMWWVATNPDLVVVAPEPKPLDTVIAPESKPLA